MINKAVFQWSMIVLMSVFSFSLSSQGHKHGLEMRKTSPSETITCPIGDHSSDLYLPVDMGRKYFNRRGNNIFVDSLFNVPDAYIPAIDYVLDFMPNFFTSTVPIHVWIEVDQLGGSALAGARPAFIVENFDFAPNKDIEYPIALAEKILGIEINGPDLPDIIVTINSEFENWYLKPNDPIGINNEAIDLASVLVHEMIHGLGFTSSSRYSEDNGTGRLAGVLGNNHVNAFDRNIINDNEEYLYETFNSPSIELGQAFTSDDLFYRSETFYNTATFPELYAPSTYAQGSSVAHLGEKYNNTRDALMTFAFNAGELRYFPGDLTLAMLYDMGWDVTRILHEPPLSIENNQDEAIIIADVKADSGFDSTSFVVHYSTDEFASVDNILPMLFDKELNAFTASLPAPGEDIEYQYYLEVMDGRNILRSNPGSAPQFFYTFNYGIDTEPPVVSVDGDLEVRSIDSSFLVAVNAFDFFSGVDTVMAAISINGEMDTIGMERSLLNSDRLFTGVYEYTRTFLPSDNIQYQFIAIDNSQNANTAIFPEADFLEAVFVPDTEAPILEHNAVSTVTNFDKSIFIKTTAIDQFTGIGEVLGVFIVNGGSPDTVMLQYAPTLFGEFYEGSYVQENEFEPGDEISYFIIGSDKAINTNSTFLPKPDSAYSVEVINIPDPVYSYENNFNVETTDFSGSGFDIGSVSGFSDEVLQSAPHPYKEGGPGQVIDFTYELLKPIVVAGSGATITFDEVALVEWGANGSRWPNDNFFDYVIVEARHLRGTEYFPLLDGYDCDEYPEWRSRYDAGLDNNGISSASPTPDLLRTREIDIKERGDFVTGDTILVRFRLFSDNAASGWGWLIDNLEIQEGNTSVDDVTINGNIDLFPNPVDNILHLSTYLNEDYGQGQISIYDVQGRKLIQQALINPSKIDNTDINVSNLESGIYLLELRLDNYHVQMMKFVKR